MLDITRQQRMEITGLHGQSLDDFWDDYTALRREASGEASREEKSQNISELSAVSVGEAAVLGFTTFPSSVDEN